MNRERPWAQEALCIRSIMNRLGRLGFSLASWLAFTGFMPTGELELPALAEAGALRLGVSLSAAMLPCMGCASNADERCFLWNGELWFGIHLHEAGSLRLRLSAMDGRSTQGDGDHGDFSGNQYLGLGIEYALSSPSTMLSFLVGTSVDLRHEQGRDGLDLLALTPYLGGVLAFRDPGQVRPFLAARLGMSLFPDLLPYAGLSAGVEIPIGDALALLTEVVGAVSASGDGILPTGSIVLGLAF